MIKLIIIKISHSCLILNKLKTDSSINLNYRLNNNFVVTIVQTMACQFLRTKCILKFFLSTVLNFLINIMMHMKICNIYLSVNRHLFKQLKVNLCQLISTLIQETNRIGNFTSQMLDLNRLIILFNFNKIQMV